MSMVFCRGCGVPIHESALACPKCGAPQGNASAQDAGLAFVLPIGRSGWAIAAGYLALFSILVLPAPFALACGVMALRDIKKDPKKTGKPRAFFGIVMGALGTLALVFLLTRILGR